MNIEIIGNKSSNQMKLVKNIKKAMEDMDILNNVKILEIVSSKKYSIKNVPALVINEDIISEGKVLTEREIFKYLKQYVGSMA